MSYIFTVYSSHPTLSRYKVGSSRRVNRSAKWYNFTPVRFTLYYKVEYKLRENINDNRSVFSTVLTGMVSNTCGSTVGSPWCSGVVMVLQCRLFGVFEVHSFFTHRANKRSLEVTVEDPSRSFVVVTLNVLPTII